MNMRLFACTLSLHAATSGVVPPGRFINGAVYVVDAARRWAAALAVMGHRITYVATVVCA